MTPLGNRIFFGFISLLLMLSYIHMIVNYAQGADTPPFAHWIVYTVPLMVGLVLITIKDEINFRFHKILTPVGLFWIATAWIIALFVDLPTARSMNLGIFLTPSEGFWFANGWGLLLAFVGFEPIYRRAYYFIPLAFFGLVFGTLELIRQIPILFSGQSVEWDAWMDILWESSGYFVTYILVSKILKEPPSFKSIAKIGGIVIGILVPTVIIAKNVIGENMLPQNTWISHWLRNEKPLYNIKCYGNECDNPAYSNPYDGFCLNAVQIGREGIVPFSLVAQDHKLIRCWYEIDSDAKLVHVFCPHNISNLEQNSATFTIINCSKSNNDDMSKVKK